MNSSQFVFFLAARLGCPPETAEQYISAIVKWMADNVIGGEKLVIRGFGKFFIEKHSEYIVRDAATRKRTLMPPRLELRFVPYPLLGDDENKEYVPMETIAAVLTGSLKTAPTVAEKAVVEFFKAMLHAMNTEGEVVVTELGAFQLTKLQLDNVLYGKVSFLPDETLSEQVNRPFSYFQPVELRDGVNFADTEELADPSQVADTPKDTFVIKTLEESPSDAQPAAEVEPAAEEGTKGEETSSEKKPAEKGSASEEGPSEKKPAEKGSAEEKEPVMEEGSAEEKGSAAKAGESSAVTGSADTTGVESTTADEQATAATGAAQCGSSSDPKVSGESSAAASVAVQSSSSSAPKVSGQSSATAAGASATAGQSATENPEPISGSADKGLPSVYANSTIIVVPNSGSSSFSGKPEPEKPRRNFTGLAVLLAAVILIGLFILIFNHSADETDGAQTSSQVIANNDSLKQAEADSAKTKMAQAETKASEANNQNDTLDLAAMNARIPYGGYNIVGIDTVITVAPGQTALSLSKMMLGTEFTEYIVAANDGNDQPQPGQKYRIPKLELRKSK